MKTKAVERRCSGRALDVLTERRITDEEIGCPIMKPRPFPTKKQGAGG